MQRASDPERESGGSPLARLWRLLEPHRGLVLGSLAMLLLNRVSGLALPGALGYLVDHVMLRREPGAMTRVIGLVLAATAVQGATDFFMNLGLARTGQGMVAEMQQRAFEHVIRLPMAFFDRQRSGGLTGRIMKDAGGLRSLVGAGAVAMLGSLMTGLLALGWLLHLSLRLTVPLIVALGLCWAVLHRLSGALRGHFHHIWRLDSELSARLTESLAGVRVVKGYAAEASEARVFAAGAGRLAEAQIAEGKAQAKLSLLGHTLLMGVSIAVLTAAVREVVLGRMTLGGFAGYIALAGYAGMAVRELGGLRAQVASAFAALERTDELLAEPAEAFGGMRLGSVQGLIRFEDVVFAYAPGDAVLQGISFEAQPGTMTALVGSSGSGKSTIAALVCGFYASAGVSVDGISIDTLDLGAYRSHLGIVSQVPFLFSGTIRENLMFGRPTASEAEMLEACRLAHVDVFVARLPQGYETLAGERGVRLSGGEQQRICLARAILADPRVLVLDEATSSLDAESEAFLGDSMRALCAGRTVFVIAHRLSTVRRADQILVVEDGRIVEAGVHEALIAARGRYFELHARQQNGIAG